MAGESVTQRCKKEYGIVHKFSPRLSFGDGPKAVKDLVAQLGQRQAKVSQHLALLRQRGIVRSERLGNEVHYSLADVRILEACHITREILLQQLTQQGTLATALTGTRES